MSVLIDNKCTVIKTVYVYMQIVYQNTCKNIGHSDQGTQTESLIASVNGQFQGQFNSVLKLTLNILTANMVFMICIRAQYYMVFAVLQF